MWILSQMGNHRIQIEVWIMKSLLHLPLCSVNQKWHPLALFLMLMMSYSFSRYQIVMLITNGKNRIFQVLLKVQLIHLKYNCQQSKQNHYLLKLLQKSKSKLKWEQEDNQRILLGLNKSKTESLPVSVKMSFLICKNRSLKNRKSS